MTQQMQTMLVCQFCGRGIQRGPMGTEHWLDEPHRTVEDFRIVRCPEHWSEWALRHTRVGRTTAMRERMRVARLQPVPVFPPLLEPFPVRDTFEE